MHAPPDPEMRSPTTLARGRADGSQTNFSTAESDTSPTDLQARLLRNRYAVAYCFACSLAPLVYGVAPR
jgi:hypothetical protein